MFLTNKDSPDYEGYIYATVIVFLTIFKIYFENISDYYSYLLGLMSKSILNCGILYVNIKSNL